jgi:hypothetical protein
LCFTSCHLDSSFMMFQQCMNKNGDPSPAAKSVAARLIYMA